MRDSQVTGVIPLKEILGLILLSSLPLLSRCCKVKKLSTHLSLLNSITPESQSKRDK